MASPLTTAAAPVAPAADVRDGGRRDRRRCRRLVPRAVARRRPRRLRHRPVGHPAARGRRPRRRDRGPPSCPARTRRSSRSPGRPTAPGWPTWSAPAAPSAPSCTSSGPTAPTPRCSRGRTPAPPSSPAAGPGPATTSARSPRATARTPTSCSSTCAPGSSGRSPAAASSSVTAVSADERLVLARRGPRGYRHIVVVDVATGRAAAGCWRSTPRAGSPPRTAASAPTALGVRPRLAARARPAPTAPAWWPSRCRTTACRGRAGSCCPAPEADLDGYALRADGTVLAVWNADGVTELWVHALSDGAAAAPDRPARAGACPAGRWPPTARRMVAELTGPRAPRSLWRVPLAGGAGRATPLPRRPAVPTRRCS